MSWITLAAVLVMWPLVGLGLAYLFGRFAQREESPEGTGNLTSPSVTHPRRMKRTKTSSRATTQTEARRAAGGKRYH